MSAGHRWAGPASRSLGKIAAAMFRGVTTRGSANGGTRRDNAKRNVPRSYKNGADEAAPFRETRCLSFADAASRGVRGRDPGLRGHDPSDRAPSASAHGPPPTDAGPTRRRGARERDDRSPNDSGVHSSPNNRGPTRTRTGGPARPPRVARVARGARRHRRAPALKQRSTPWRCTTRSGSSAGSSFKSLRLVLRCGKLLMSVAPG